MKLIAYAIGHHANPLRKASRLRDWMDATGKRFAYRCLPLTMANVHGWEICCSHKVTAVWNGGIEPDDLIVEGPSELAMSHFGWGVLTFFPGYLFRTEPGYDLMVTGPFNRPKTGITALTGLVETDWAPYHFTMNWQMEPDVPVVFEVDEPFCLVYPQPRTLLEAVEPEIRDLASNPELEAAHNDWLKQRESLLARRVDGDIDWDKNYTHGRMPDGQLGAEDHRTKLELPDFKDTRKK